MSTSEPAPAAGDDSFMDYVGDRTQPSAESILSALSALNGVVKTESTSQNNVLPPPSEYDVLTAQLAENPHNPEGWRKLVNIAESTGEIDKISATYDALLKQYPNTATAQIQYISHFTSNENTFEKAEALFTKFLKSSPCVELWSFYLTYVRRLNSSNAQRDIVRKSYEFALNHIGQDKDSGAIWSDYLQFLRSGETTTTWEEQQKMDSLRKVYHRAVQIPLENVEQLWQDLEAFETNLNKITAKKFMADLSPAHMQARTVLRQLVNHVTPLYSPSNQFQQDLYLPSLPTFNASERALVGKWKAYLKWEEGNPLEIEDKDKAVLITRLQGVYRKAVVRMRYYTEIWFMAYTWANSVGKVDEAMTMLKAGLEANPSSFLLTFAYAETLEIKKDYAEVHATYDRFLGILRANLEKIEQQANSADSSFLSNGTQPNTSIGAIANHSANHNVATNGNASGANGDTSLGSSFNSQSSSEEKPVKATELQKHRTEYGLAWIMYMRFGKRAEGVKSSRTAFGKARKDRWTPWEVYEAAALMEYHCSDDKAVASRIFERGLDQFIDEIEFVLRYLGFLISINDENNARALFERVIPIFPPDRARPLWERWARYEYQYGDLEASLKLEKRMADVYSSDPPIKRLAQRHIYLGTDAIADRDLGFAIARRTAAIANASGVNAIGRSETNQSLLSGSQQSQGHHHAHHPPPPPPKRPASPDYRKRDDARADYAAGHKRARPLSPPPQPPPPSAREREREGRWADGAGGAGGPSRRRGFSPPPAVASWDRDDRGPPGGRGGGAGGRGDVIPPRGGAHDREDEKPRQAALPPILSWFIGELPTPASFDGPVFRTDDLMNLFRNAVIPSSSARPKSPPPPPRAGGRPPPDYGPYQGPNGGGRRRY